ncbi:MAG: hypothetical protein M1840_005224 [Geoglossum simile]|nr:MAG: hypothetical protein M1840_005224 [Geoglossum simile]
MAAALLPNTSDTESKAPGQIPSTPGPSCYLLNQLRAPTLAVTAVTPTELLYAQLEKLVVNAMINPPTVIFDCYYGQLFNRSPVGTLMLLHTEAAAVVRGLVLRSSDSGVDAKAVLESRFSQPTLEELVRTVATKTGKDINSMLQDARASRRWTTSTAT